jgi:hypothetical protein
MSSKLMTPVSQVSELLPPPRQVKVSADGRAQMMLPIYVGVFLLLIATFWVVSRHRHMRSLLANGRLENATVSDKTVSTGKSTTYTLSLGYIADGQPYTGSETVDVDAYNNAVINVTRVPVTYLASDPNQYEIGVLDSARAEDDLNKTSTVLLGIAAVTLLWFAIVAVNQLKDMAFGGICLAATGQISSLYTKKVYHKGGSSTEYWVSYEFVLEDQRYYRSVKVDKEYNTCHQVGQSIVILYDPKHPSSNRLQSNLTTVCTEQVV